MLFRILILSLHGPQYYRNAFVDKVALSSRNWLFWENLPAKKQKKGGWANYRIPPLIDRKTVPTFSEIPGLPGGVPPGAGVYGWGRVAGGLAFIPSLPPSPTFIPHLFLPDFFSFWTRPPLLQFEVYLAHFFSNKLLMGGGGGREESRPLSLPHLIVLILCPTS